MKYNNLQQLTWCCSFQSLFAPKIIITCAMQHKLLPDWTMLCMSNLKPDQKNKTQMYTQHIFEIRNLWPYHKDHVK